MAHRLDASPTFLECLGCFMVVAYVFCSAYFLSSCGDLWSCLLQSNSKDWRPASISEHSKGPSSWFCHSPLTVVSSGPFVRTTVYGALCFFRLDSWADMFSFRGREKWFAKVVKRISPKIVWMEKLPRQAPKQLVSRSRIIQWAQNHKGSMCETHRLSGASRRKVWWFDNSRPPSFSVKECESRNSHSALSRWKIDLEDVQDYATSDHFLGLPADVTWMNRQRFNVLAQKTREMLFQTVKSMSEEEGCCGAGAWVKLFRAYKGKNACRSQRLTGRVHDIKCVSSCSVVLARMEMWDAALKEHVKDIGCEVGDITTGFHLIFLQTIVRYGDVRKVHHRSSWFATVLRPKAPKERSKWC